MFRWYQLGPVNHQKMCTGTTLFFGPKGYALKIAENALSREPLVVGTWETPHFVQKVHVSISV